MKLTDRQRVMVCDLLHNLHPRSSGGSHEYKVGYAKGMLVAVVGMIQGFKTNLDFEKAIKIAAENAPRVVIAGCCPDSWCKDFGMPGVGERDESWDENTVVRIGPAHD